jgi:hypothetical protein
LRRDYEPYFLQVCGFRHNIGDDQVPDVDRVKRAKEETDFQVRYS